MTPSQPSVAPHESTHPVVHHVHHRAVGVSPPTLSTRLASASMMLLIGVLVLAALAFSGVIPTGWLLGEHKVGTTTLPEGPRVEMVKPGTLTVPLEVRKALGLHRGGKDVVQEVARPKKGAPLVLPGSTMLDPTRLLRIRARFAPAEVVEIGKSGQQAGRGGSVDHEWRSGDRVPRGAVLGVFYSVDVGSKKNDLYDAVVQLKLDEEILDRAEKARGSVPEIFILNARRNVLSDRNAIVRAENTLRTWNIPEEEIRAVRQEAESADLEALKASRDKDPKSKDRQREAAKQEQLKRWARVELKAPEESIIIERNVARHEIVVDPTTNLFVLARLDRIAVVANAPEDDLPTVQGLSPAERVWTIRTVGGRSRDPKTGQLKDEMEGEIDEIGFLIDPNQHTAPIKGYIQNIKNDDNTWRLRAGQFVSVTINLPAPKDVVEVPINAIVDDGRQCVVFVQPDPTTPTYVLRRVLVTSRFDGKAYVRSALTDADRFVKPEDREQGVRVPEPLQVGERVLLSGVLELKKELEDREAAAAENDG